MKKYIIITLIALLLVAACVLVLALSLKPKTVGKAIKESDFKEFYYTYSSTVNPPEFQRYRIYTENGKKMFYHEKREGDKTFLNEEDITVNGTMELTAEQWEALWNCLDGGKVTKRKESTDSGNAGPWLYLYWNGDNGKYQQFSFADAEKQTEFEKLCKELKSR